jgi:hypothetical protein
VTTAIEWARRAASVVGIAVGVAAAAGCPATQFPDEGPGQPSDWQSGFPGPSTIGVCREPNTKRPPIVSPQLWENARRCDRLTPKRFLRLGYGKADLADDPADRRMAAMLDAMRAAMNEKDGNLRMIGMMRAVKREVSGDPKFSARIERQTSRTFACDYTYLFNTTEKQYRRLSDDPCPAYAYDRKQRQEVCMFDLNVREAVWLTSAWSCLAFTETVGEGGSCYRLCAYDDFCEAQVGCSAPDFDLALCALGVCTPERVAGIL